MRRRWYRRGGWKGRQRTLRQDHEFELQYNWWKAIGVFCLIVFVFLCITSLLRHNLHTIKFILLKSINQWFLVHFIELYSHHRCLILEHFYYCRKKPCNPLAIVPHSPLLPAPDNHQSTDIDLLILGIKYK